MNNDLQDPKVSLGSGDEYGSGSNINPTVEKNHKTVSHHRTWDLKKVALKRFFYFHYGHGECLTKGINKTNCRTGIRLSLVENVLSLDFCPRLLTLRDLR